MTDQTQNNNPDNTPSRPIPGTILLVIACLMIIGGFYQIVTGNNADYTLFSVGVLAVCVLYAASRIDASTINTTSQENNANDSLLKQQIAILQTIEERLLISDQAKRIAFRQKDRDALREAIVEDIRVEDYAAANALVDDMAEVYGYREEAEKFRAQVHDAETKRRNEIIDQSTIHVDDICKQYQWDKAHQEVNRISRLFPGNARVTELHQRVNASKDQHKHDLERQFLEAAENDQLEKAMDLLKELDSYLSAHEAKPYLEVARGVIGKKKENMGVRFKMAVQDRDWIRALSVGETIIRDFPNSLFANEVRGMIDLLRERAAGQRAASQTPDSNDNSTQPPNPNVTIL